jgi:LL-diaminopimelate aminotransferase
MELMDKTGVIVTPGASFGPAGEGYVRFALVMPPERIQEVIEAMREGGMSA